MLGFSKGPGIKVSKEALKEMLETVERHKRGEYTDEEKEFMHNDKVTPEIFLIGKNETTDPKCAYCDAHRSGKCEGRIRTDDDCPDFSNEYDLETCKYCKHANFLEEDVRHIMCPKKGKKLNAKWWCKLFDKE
jgi:hypothetical protein